MVPCFAQTSFDPIGEGTYPVILTHGVYAKGLPFNGPIYKMQWDKLVAKDPSVLDGSTNKHQAWEVTDPERWVPHGYALARVDSRGAGWSPGVLWPRNPLEFDDIADSVEWAGTQPWSTGRVGILGISYYAVMGWAAAERQPEHLAALIAWEGFTDSYRDAYYHGGILSEFTRRWQERQINPIQYGQGERAPVNPNTGQSVAGPVTLPEDELVTNRQESFPEIKSHPLFDDWHRERAVDLSRVSVPFLSAANWGARASTRGATSTVLSKPPPRTSGSRHTATPTGPTSTRRTGVSCRSASSTTSSKERTTASTAHLGSSSTSDTPGRDSCGGGKTSGPWHARSGPSITCIPISF